MFPAPRKYMQLEARGAVRFLLLPLLPMSQPLTVWLPARCAPLLDARYPLYEMASNQTSGQSSRVLTTGWCFLEVVVGLAPSDEHQHVG